MIKIVIFGYVGKFIDTSLKIFILCKPSTD